MSFTEDESRRARQDFPALERAVEGRPLAYLDGPAGSQVPRQVIDAIREVYEHHNANTHGGFPTSRETDGLMHEAREAAAALLNAPSWREVSFGQNMTTLTFQVAHALEKELRPGDEVVVTALDHEANRGPWLALADRGIVVQEVGLGRDGHLQMEDFERKVNERTRLVAVGLASNALGTVNELGAVRALTAKAGAWLYVDAVHYAPHFPLDVQELDPDFLVCSAYKFYGPHVGVLYTRPGLLDQLSTDRLRTQEEAAPWRIETGTLNHAAIAGTRAAIDYIASWGEGETRRARIVSALRGIAAWERGLARDYAERVAEVPGVTVWGPDFLDSRRAPTVSITIDGVHPTEAARKLGEKGVQVWDGHFYAARAVEVLRLASRGGLLRTGVLLYNSPEEIDRLVEGIAEIAREGKG